jgi:hypothetical protein
MYKKANESAEQKAYLTNLHALKRIASPDELAQAALYLASTRQVSNREQPCWWMGPVHHKDVRGLSQTHSHSMVPGGFEVMS